MSASLVKKKTHDPGPSLSYVIGGATCKASIVNWPQKSSSTPVHTFRLPYILLLMKGSVPDCWISGKLTTVCFFHISSVSSVSSNIVLSPGEKSWFKILSLFLLVLCIHLPVFNLTQTNSSEANVVDYFISPSNLLNCFGIFYIKRRASWSPSSGALRSGQNIVWIWIKNKSHISRSRCAKVPSLVPQPHN